MTYAAKVQEHPVLAATAGVVVPAEERRPEPRPAILVDGIEGRADKLVCGLDAGEPEGAGDVFQGELR